MNDFNKTTKNIILLLFAHFIVLLILGAFFRNASVFVTAFGETAFFVYASGLFFGILFSVVKLFLLRFALVTSLKKSKNKATMYFYGQYLLRYFLTGFILYISIVNSHLDFFGTILGVLALQSSSYIAGFLIKKDPNLKDKIEKIEKELDL